MHIHTPHKGQFWQLSLPMYSKFIVNIFFCLCKIKMCKVKGCELLFSFVRLCLHGWKDYQIAIITLFGEKGKWTSVWVCVFAVHVWKPFCEQTDTLGSRRRVSVWSQQVGTTSPRLCLDMTWHDIIAAKLTNVIFRGHEVSVWMCQ